MLTNYYCFISMPLHYQQPRPGTLCFLLLSFHLSVAQSMPICWIQYIRNSLTGFIIIRWIYLDRPNDIVAFFGGGEFILLIMTKWNVKNVKKNLSISCDRILLVLTFQTVIVALHDKNLYHSFHLDCSHTWTALLCSKTVELSQMFHIVHNTLL